MGSKYTYKIEVQTPNGNWFAPCGSLCSREYGFGYLASVRDCPPPRLPHRLVRSDSKVVDEVPGNSEVGIGMIAGWPSWQQYAQAAVSALKRASEIAIRAEDSKVDTGGRLASTAIAIQDIIKDSEQ